MGPGPRAGSTVGPGGRVGERGRGSSRDRSPCSGSAAPEVKAAESVTYCVHMVHLHCTRLEHPFPSRPIHPVLTIPIHLSIVKWTGLGRPDWQTLARYRVAGTFPRTPGHPQGCPYNRQQFPIPSLVYFGPSKQDGPSGPIRTSGLYRRFRSGYGQTDRTDSFPVLGRRASFFPPISNNQ